jgi:hypothetical protein
VSRRIKLSILIAACIFAAGGAAWWLVAAERSPIAFVLGLRHAITQGEQALLYQTDHKVLAQVMREFASERQWSSGHPPRSTFGDFIFFYGEDSSLPLALRVLKPSSVRVFDDRVECEFGGAFLHFGIAAFRPGLAGHGTKKLGDGIWFYAEDGRVPSR